MSARNQAVVSVLDKLSGIRATMNKDEREALDLIVISARSDASSSEVEAHGLAVEQVEFGLEAGSIRLQDNAYEFIREAR